MKHLRTSIASILFLLYVAIGAAPVTAQPDDVANAIETARQDIQTLTSREFAGRGYWLDGHEKAAEYIRERFQEIGLQGVQGRYYQPFTVQTDYFTTPPQLVINGTPLRFGKDFICNPGNEAGKGVSDGIVDAGDGIVIPPKRVDAYKGRVTEGLVILIRPELLPEAIKADTTIDPEYYNTETRIMVAGIIKKGGAVLIPKERLTYGDFFQKYSMPVFEVREGVLPKSIDEVSYNVASEKGKTFTTNNVMGFLPGTSKPDSLIIICGHYDHLGAINDTLYFPGANDNASGIALMLALAEQLKANPLPYSVLFVAFSGEEIGLRGSCYFADNPPVDLGKVRFLLNLDMAASGPEGVMALGGVDFPEEYNLLAAVNDSLGGIRELRKRANAANSDHYCILQRGVRGFYVYPFTGQQPYHHVDDKPETLEWEVFQNLYTLLGAFLRKL